MNAIVDKRYNEFKKDRGGLTHCVFNLKLRGDGNDSIQGRYDKRMLSRLYEMCNVVYFGQPDQRLPEHMRNQ